MSDALDDAQRSYKEFMQAHARQRRQIEEDLKFSDPSNPQQWEEDVKHARETDPGGKRPCLVMDQCGQYVANVAGQIEQKPPSIHAIPVGGGADQKAAEQIDGRFRHIEHASRATQHYMRALTSAARAGVGYLVVRPEYIDRALGYQEPRIGSEPDPLKVVFDPWSTDTDGYDAEEAFIANSLSCDRFEERWPGRKLVNFGDTDTRRGDERKDVLIAEHWKKQATKIKMLVYTDAQGREASDTQDDYMEACVKAQKALPISREYMDKTHKVIWTFWSGEDELEKADYPADCIGVVPLYGYVGFVDGRMTYCGIPRRARNPQQAYNYHVSEMQALTGMVVRAPYAVSKRAAKGVETLWDKAGAEQRGWLPYNDIDEDGAIAAPTKLNASVNLANQEAGAMQALKDIQASIGMYQANLGAQGNETSGVAIENRKQQGEASTAHFPAHMAASLGQVGNIVMQMDARLADTRRQQPIIGIDQSPGSVTVNPEQDQAFVRNPDGVSINPNVGKYGVRVVVGSSYSTQRTQTNAAFAEIMRGNKELAPVVAPFWAQTLDFPGSDKFAQAMAAMAPAPVKAILQPEGSDKQQDPAVMAQQLAEAKAALQEAIQHAKEAQDDADQAIAGQADAKRLAEVRERELDIKAYEAETDRLKVTGANEEQIKAITGDLINQMLSSPDPLPGDPPQVAQPAIPTETPETQPEDIQTGMPPAAPMQQEQPQQGM
jgi:hypothetical protein